MSLRGMNEGIPPGSRTPGIRSELGPQSIGFVARIRRTVSKHHDIGRSIDLVAGPNFCRAPGKNHGRTLPHLQGDFVTGSASGVGAFGGDRSLPVALASSVQAR